MRGRLPRRRGRNRTDTHGDDSMTSVIAALHKRAEFGDHASHKAGTPARAAEPEAPCAAGEDASDQEMAAERVRQRQDPARRRRNASDPAGPTGPRGVTRNWGFVE